MTATVLPRWLADGIEFDFRLGDGQVGDPNPDALPVFHGDAIGAGLQSMPGTTKVSARLPLLSALTSSLLPEQLDSIFVSCRRVVCRAEASLPLVDSSMSTSPPTETFTIQALFSNPVPSILITWPVTAVLGSMVRSNAPTRILPLAASGSAGVTPPCRLLVEPVSFSSCSPRRALLGTMKLNSYSSMPTAAHGPPVGGAAAPGNFG